MKNILCYGDSNTWGQVPGSMDVGLRLAKRYSYGVRWTSVLQQLLGSEFHVLEAGLNGRSTSFDEVNSMRPSRNGLAALPLLMDTNYPLDLVVIMLGTNDTRTDIDADLDRIVHGMRQLIECVQSSYFGPNFTSPKVMILAPAPILSSASKNFDVYNDTSVAKSKKLPELYEKLAQEKHCYFLSIAPFVTVSETEGVHLEQDSHAELAKAMAVKIKQTL